MEVETLQRTILAHVKLRISVLIVRIIVLYWLVFSP
jgi:hypothetical protein